MNERDPELAGLLVRELERHLPVLEARPIDEEAAWRAVQAVKGSAGLAGEDELFAALERIDRRVREGDGGALAEAAALVRAAELRLTGGPPAPARPWHVPPDDLPVGVISPRIRDAYAAEVRDRLARIDEALASDEDPLEVGKTLFRHVHTLKGAGSSVGDEAMGWFCHGLEERIKGADESSALAAAAIAEVARWRTVLAGLAEDPAATLTALRSGRRPSPSAAPPRRHRPGGSSRTRPPTRSQRSACAPPTWTACSSASTWSIRCARASPRAAGTRAAVPRTCGGCGPRSSRRCGSSGRRGHGGRPRRPSSVWSARPPRPERSASCSTRPPPVCAAPRARFGTTSRAPSGSSPSCDRPPPAASSPG